MIRHMVHLRFSDTVSADEIASLYEALDGLRAHIDGILDFQTRKNVSVEAPLVRGFHDMFWFDFQDVAVRDRYLADAAHQAIGRRIVDKLQGGPEGVFVCDIHL